MMTDAQKTIKFLAAIPTATKALILNNIAEHYGITSAEAYDEVTDDEAESLLDYVTGAERAATSLLMKRHRLA
jgi:DNA-binding transcriptional ArsR family regulator